MFKVQLGGNIMGERKLVNGSLVVLGVAVFVAITPTVAHADGAGMGTVGMLLVGGVVLLVVLVILAVVGGACGLQYLRRRRETRAIDCDVTHEGRPQD
jgi:hypothetical protein